MSGTMLLNKNSQNNSHDSRQVKMLYFWILKLSISMKIIKIILLFV